MASIIYSKLEGKNDPLYGKFEHPIKAIIENESNQCEKNQELLKYLFNVEKSNRYAETIIGQSDFDTFQHASEGQGAENDSVETTYKKTIEHIPFMKEFTITKEMADDAKFGIGADIKQRARNFTRAYYKTQNKLAAWALINGTTTSGTFNKATVDLTCADGLALFNKAHTSSTGKTANQSNFYAGGSNSTNLSTANIEATLGKLANIMRNFKDENNETLGYVADVVIVPCNRPALESAVKKCVGSERTVGSNNNDINTQYGNWTVVVLDGWETTDDRIMVMSKEANENLMGNMFYNRIPLDISSWVDNHTRNYVMNGYTRMGIGFNTWKHILLYQEGANSSATTLS